MPNAGFTNSQLTKHTQTRWSLHTLSTRMLLSSLQDSTERLRSQYLSNAANLSPELHVLAHKRSALAHTQLVAACYNTTLMVRTVARLRNFSCTDHRQSPRSSTNASHSSPENKMCDVSLGHRTTHA